MIEDHHICSIENGAQKFTVVGWTTAKLSISWWKFFFNQQCPEQCVACLYQKYLALRPVVLSDALYLQPLSKPRDDCWYKTKPVGHNPLLSLTVKKVTEKLGLEGYYTNHSLRRTCATRLYRKGIEGQQVIAAKMVYEHTRWLLLIKRRNWVQFCNVAFKIKKISYYNLQRRNCKLMTIKFLCTTLPTALLLLIIIKNHYI